jgi:hypothetical protein
VEGINVTQETIFPDQESDDSMMQLITAQKSISLRGRSIALPPMI